VHVVEAVSSAFGFAGVPLRFEHAYSDHVTLEAGPTAQVLVEDADGGAVVAAATVGRGRVLLNGMISGYAVEGVGVRGASAPPEGGEKAFLLGGIRWLGQGLTERHSPVRQ
jgi:hypothetical protein